MPRSARVAPGKSFILVVCVSSSLAVAQDPETLPSLENGRAPQNFDLMWAGFDPRTEPLETKTLKEWEEKLRLELPPGMELRRSSTKELGSHLVAARSNREIVKLTGPDLTVLRSKAEVVCARISDVRGTTDPRVDPSDDIPHLKFEIDRHNAARFGVTLTDVFEATRLSAGETAVSQIRDGNRSFDLIIKAADLAPGPEDIDRFPVRNTKGELIRLGQVAKMKLIAVPRVIYRENLQPTVFISYRVKGREKSEVQAETQKTLNVLKHSLGQLEGGYRIEYGD